MKLVQGAPEIRWFHRNARGLDHARSIAPGWRRSRATSQPASTETSVHDDGDASSGLSRLRRRPAIASSMSRTTATSCAARIAASAERRPTASTQTATTPGIISPGSDPMATPTISVPNRFSAGSSPGPCNSSATFVRPAGCWTSDAPMGFFLQEARRHFDVTGIELAEDAAEHCRRSGLNVITGQADESLLKASACSTSSCCSTSSSICLRPRETVALLARHLNPGGIIVVTTGDFGALSARLAGAQWRLMTPPQHLWFFSQESMRRMTASLGLEGGASRSSVEDRAAVADHIFSSRAWPGLHPAPVPAWGGLGFRSTCSTPCASCCGSRCHERSAFTQARCPCSSAYAAAMAGGQLLFKIAAMRGAGARHSSERIAGLLLNGYFIVALVLYAALTVLWVWILSFTPLSRAYPFVALAFALTPALGSPGFRRTCIVSARHRHRADPVRPLLHSGMKRWQPTIRQYGS